MERAAGVLHCTLHLVEHHALELQAAVAVSLQAMALLEEVQAAKAGEEHGVEINLRAGVSVQEGGLMEEGRGRRACMRLW